jgi:hypothetical protein
MSRQRCKRAAAHVVDVRRALLTVMDHRGVNTVPNWVSATRTLEMPFNKQLRFRASALFALAARHEF